MSSDLEEEIYHRAWVFVLMCALFHCCLESMQSSFIIYGFSGFYYLWWLEVGGGVGATGIIRIAYPHPSKTRTYGSDMACVCDEYERMMGWPMPRT